MMRKIIGMVVVAYLVAGAALVARADAFGVVPSSRTVRCRTLYLTVERGFPFRPRLRAVEPCAPRVVLFH